MVHEAGAERMPMFMALHGRTRVGLVDYDHLSGARHRGAAEAVVSCSEAVTTECSR